MVYDSVICGKIESAVKGSEISIYGFSDLSVVENLPFPNLKTGITIGIALNPSIVKSLVSGPDREYAAEYSEVNRKLSEVADDIKSFIAGLGYSAGIIPPTMPVNSKDELYSPFPHKTAATLAGLGWIGKSALLITKEFGAALRITTIFTDAPLKTGIPVEKSYCGGCTECLKKCPAGAVSGKEWYPGLLRDDFWDGKACFEYSSKAGKSAGSNHPVCGICIAVCPWTQGYLRRSLNEL
ncbi:4Fe-4S ferredoxin iron-sulfur binding domain-containing protein [Methanoplanus limicola DSM 2279]|uniref:4Fe-4S ferredoxin iron-sulfur binding domain-containing protein n=1 Tax=Methanoplanus limicola DSM 2279 TaxID=937775 RepID=H1Z3M0_9EURY|nr:4Fe-4S ferredoxin iron-sulfur binding domain-containing protein [Methanoplanus limicola DSM 2279]